MNQAQLFVSRLIDWFSAQARDLPWRHTLDPYAIWISEVMLQQTQVKTVIPYWERWTKELPDVRALARARPERVLKLWEGLGYYSRARNLQKAARQILRDHAGRFPSDFPAILALAGVGRYTAGAISSIAFNQPRPILDGNVIRVLTRLFGITANARERDTLVQLWARATSLVEAAGHFNPAKPLPAANFAHQHPSPTRAPARKPSPALPSSGPCSLLNQALMELGATVCIPRHPKCGDCPLQSDCIGYSSGQREQLPNLGRRPTPSARRFQAFLVEHEKQWLVVRRPPNVLNAQLWEFPNIEANAQTDPSRSARAVLGVEPLALTPFHTIRHSITRYRIALAAYRARVAERPVPPHQTTRWLSLAQLERLAFSSAHRQLLRRLREATNEATGASLFPP